MNSPSGHDDLVARLGRWSAGRGPLYLLLARRLRRLIDDGELAPGALLPPDRALAAVLAVGRTTVVSAYDLLSQDGKIVRRQGSGTRVAPAAPKPEPRRFAGAATPLFLHLLEPPDHVIQLTCAAPTAVPAAVKEAYLGALSGPFDGDLGYHPAGHPTLRQALATRYSGRGLPTEPGQILVTTGAQQGLSLLAQQLISPGDKVIVEAPTYPGALEVFREAAAVLQSVPSPAAGLDTEEFLRVLRDERPAAAYLIPTHHNPTGTVLSTMVRRGIAEAAAGLGVWIIEDEVLAELGFSTQGPQAPGPHPDAPPSLATFAPDSVVTVGSLSKIIWGGLRVGWVRGPAPLIMRLARSKAVHDLGSAVITQLAAAELVTNLDTLREHRVAELRRQHDRLCAELAARLPEWLVPRAAGGQTLWVRLPHGDGISFAQVALRHGVAVLPGTSLDVSGGSEACLRIPFLESPEKLAEAVGRLAVAWREYTPVTGTSAFLAPMII